jgi:hypothetical protein
MNDILLDRDSTMNRSGFEDDSMIYEEENTKNKNKNLGNSINLMLSDDTLSSGRQQILSPDIMNPNGNSINEANSSMFEDSYTNIYYIPMNRPSKFSSDKMAHQFTYKSNPKSRITNTVLNSKNFALSQNSEIITYLLCLFVFSEFANLDELEDDKRFKVIILKKNKNRFEIENKDKFLNKLELLPKDKENDLQDFINDVNHFLEENDLSLKKKKQKEIYIIFGYSAIALLLIIIFIILIVTDASILILFAGIIIIIFYIAFLVKIIKNTKVLFLYYDLEYFLLNHNTIMDCFEMWNRNLFENYKIRVTAPISMNYIMFNLNPYQDIEIQHLDMNWIKQKYYKNQKTIFANKTEENLFNSIKHNMKYYEEEKYSIN